MFYVHSQGSLMNRTFKRKRFIWKRIYFTKKETDSPYTCTWMV